jgi:hypothetical protein
MVPRHKRLVLIVAAVLLASLNYGCPVKLSVYTKADSIAGLYPHHSLKDLRLLSQKLTSPLSADTEKFRAIYKWVCSNITTDYELVEINREKRMALKNDELIAWNRKMNDRMITMLVEEHKTLCTGYAWLVRELSQHAGIRCEIISGYGRRPGSNVGGATFPNHSWNAVLLGNKWHLCDPTWSAGHVDLATGEFKLEFEDAYFLADPELFILNHYPLDTAWMFVDRKPLLEEFLNGPVVYAKTLEYKVVPTSPKNFRIVISKDETIPFVLEGECNDAINCIIGRKRTVVKNNRVDHTFTRRGVYPVHFVIGVKFIASYEVTVR